jgi:4-hydroxyphenylpyruvate dioxygenase-like putative hemolysin
MEAERKGVNHLATQTRTLLSRKAVRQFIKENGKYITQVESTFYTLLEQRIKNTILKAIGNNASRKRLSQYEPMGNGNSKEVK